MEFYFAANWTRSSSPHQMTGVESQQKHRKQKFPLLPEPVFLLLTLLQVEKDYLSAPKP